MVQNDKINLDQAISYLKAGYHLVSIIGKREIRFFYREDKILVFGEEHFLSLNEYSFKEIYHDCLFEIDTETEEEAVDMKKDEEYYSWKQ